MSQKSNDDLAVDFAALRERLINARNRYAIDNERIAAAEALHAVNQFLQDRCKANDLPAETLIPLNELLSALADIEGGHEHPLITPAKSTGGRPKKSNHYTNIMGTVSAAITFLMDGKLNEEEAARKIAGLMEKYNLPFPEGRASTQWGKLTSMRDRLNQGWHKDPALIIQDGSILDYCETDVRALESLLPSMVQAITSSSQRLGWALLTISVFLTFAVQYRQRG